MLQSIAMGTMIVGSPMIPTQFDFLPEMKFEQEITAQHFESALLDRAKNYSRVTTQPNLWFATQKSTISSSDKLIGKLTSYLDLDSGWDGYSGQSPSSEAVSDAIEFIQKHEAGMNSAIPMLSSDGEIGLLWKTHGNYIDIGFYGDGLYSLYAKLSDGKELLLDDESIDNEFNDEILSVLNQLG